MIAPVQRTVIARDALVAYYHWAPRKESTHPAVVLLHGWRSGALVWADCAAGLAEHGYPVYAVDFPGFGESETPSTPFTLDDYVGVLSVFLDKQKLQHVFLVGHSFGGRVAIKYAASQPRMLAKLVLVSSAGVKPPERKLIKNIAAVARPFFRFQFMQIPRRKLYELIGAGDYLATPRLQQTFVNIISEDLTPYLSRVVCPTLIIWGDKDKETPPEMGAFMQKELPHARLVMFENAGHFSFLDEPERFLKSCLEFFASP